MNVDGRQDRFSVREFRGSDAAPDADRQVLRRLYN